MLLILNYVENLQGAINDLEFMEKILKEHEIDIVISAVGGANIMHQSILIHALKAVGTIKVIVSSKILKI